MALLKEVELRETGEVQVGRGSVGDLAERGSVSSRPSWTCGPPRMTSTNMTPGRSNWSMSLVSADEGQEASYKTGRITIDRIADASLQLAEAELRTASTPHERMAIKKRHFDRLKMIEEREEVEVKEGRGTKADLAEATMRCVEAEMDLHDAITFNSTPDLSPILAVWANLNERSRSSEGAPTI